MVSSAAVIVLQAVLVLNPPASYERAYAQSQNSGQPLVVLVGAQWCPACVSMKHNVIPRMSRGGQLDGVNYAEVDADSESELAGRLMRGGAIPQLIVFSRGNNGQWQRRQITGGTSEAGVTALIDQAQSEVRMARESGRGPNGN
jgi:thioredoxin-like negative regulator of GroEL